MPAEKIITSVNNPRIKNIVRLREKKARDSQDLMIIDGIKAIRLALDNPVAVKELFYCDSLLRDKEERGLVERAKKKKADIFSLNRKVFARIAYGDNAEGIIAVAVKVKRHLKNLAKGKSGLYLILESLEKPGNLGAVLRTSDAAGADAVIVCDSRTDIFNPNVIRSSRGTFFTLPVVEASNLEALLWLKQNQIQIISSSPDAKLEYTQVDFRKPSAVVLGSEHKGLSPFWLNSCELKIKIPMKGQVDSLNVSTAAAIILYEAVRQRRD
jgi:TrmH family RNA methyltransferase